MSRYEGKSEKYTKRELEGWTKSELIEKILEWQEILCLNSY